MKLRKNYLTALLAPALVAMAMMPAPAQVNSAANLSKDTIAMETGTETPVRRETLSGIDLYPLKKTDNVFMLSFQQDLKEDGVLEFKNASGKVLFTKPVTAGDHTLAPPMRLGKLGAGIYLVEVKTPTTVYWKKLRVRL
ncbi:T9SS type A sorting domain-containing protein [Rufibacter roseus]|uniref:T9SS type A sorting domain-containing protein n=1 Tax=Rufibacter roseus TaxID=1567108 RepID=A0ABW2DJS2_9BACT|nr:hypothetical protein [Rufibacter roseus]